MAFRDQTTLKRIFVGTITKPTGGGVAQPLNLPPTGILSRLWLIITGTITGTITSPNALGMACIINRCRVVAQGGQDMFNLSGPGYHYLYRPYIDLGLDPIASQSAFAAVSATTFNVSMVLPVQFNARDEVGLFMLQNAETLVSINLDWLNDNPGVGTGATVAATAKVYADIFTVPPSQKDWPDFSLIHQVLEDQQAVAAAGQQTYTWPRGSIYLRLLHGLGFAQAGADNWSAYQIKRNESDIIYDIQDVNEADMAFSLMHGGVTPKPGVFAWDGVGFSGLGSYGMARDTLDSRRYTNLKTVVTSTAAGTLYAVRDTLLPVPAR